MSCVTHSEPGLPMDKQLVDSWPSVNQHMHHSKNSQMSAGCWPRHWWNVNGVSTEVSMVDWLNQSTIWHSTLEVLQYLHKHKHLINVRDSLSQVTINSSKHFINVLDSRSQRQSLFSVLIPWILWKDKKHRDLASGPSFHPALTSAVFFIIKHRHYLYCFQWHGKTWHCVQ